MSFDRHNHGSFRHWGACLAAAFLFQVGFALVARNATVPQSRPMADTLELELISAPSETAPSPKKSKSPEFSTSPAPPQRKMTVAPPPLAPLPNLTQVSTAPPQPKPESVNQPLLPQIRDAAPTARAAVSQTKPAAVETGSSALQGSGATTQVTSVQPTRGGSGHFGASRAQDHENGGNRLKPPMLGDYLALVRAKVESHKEYPSSARQMGYQGTVTVRVTIKANGNIDSVTVVNSSGHKYLDKAAVSAVRSAAPFRSSAGFGLSDVTMEIPITYRLN